MSQAKEDPSLHAGVQPVAPSPASRDAHPRGVRPPSRVRASAPPSLESRIAGGEDGDGDGRVEPARRDGEGASWTDGEDLGVENHNGRDTSYGDRNERDDRDDRDDGSDDVDKQRGDGIARADHGSLGDAHPSVGHGASLATTDGPEGANEAVTGGGRCLPLARFRRLPPVRRPREACLGGPEPHRGASRRLYLRLPVLPFCPGAMVRTTEQDGAVWHLFDARDVPRFFAQEKYTCFYWHGAQGPEEHLLADSLDALEVRLANFGFVRTHRAELVNLRFLRRVSWAGRGDRVVVELADGQRSFVSRRRLGQVRNTLRHLRADERLPASLGVRALPL